MSKKIVIDINVDLGEGYNNESQLMPYLSSCNIACGGHAGDEKTMLEVVRLAKQHGIKIGAHPSFPDKKNFGRMPMIIGAEQLTRSLVNQVETFLSIASEENIRVNHIKPHGALYNLAAKELKTATIIIEVIRHFDLKLKLYAPYKSVVANEAIAHGIEVVYEAFADRNYNNDLSLVSRTKPNAVINNPESVLRHLKSMAEHHQVLTINGVGKELKADTFCIHGDNKNAETILKFLSQKLGAENIEIA
ncbi:MAG: 5-oxoprolinase subunit PxpA [Bacteroidota bacterium]